jgi:predicted esterase
MKSLMTLFVIICAMGRVSGQTIRSNAEQFISHTGVPREVMSYVSEDFEEQRCPPAGWTLEYAGDLFWSHYKGASAYGIGTGSMLFCFWNAPAGTIQSLVLSSMGSSVEGDSLSFDYAYAAHPSVTDRLVVETSADRGGTYSMLAGLNGGYSGPLVTTSRQAYPFIPTASEWATKRYALPVGTNRIRFTAMSAWGNYLYLDNCIVGTRAIGDAGAQSIDIATPTFTVPQIPMAAVKNHGTAAQTFTVTMLISPGGYASTKTVMSLAGNATMQVTFDRWTPASDTNSVVVFTSLGADMDRTNDTLRMQIVVNAASRVSNIDAAYRNGQVFITWDNVKIPNVIYTVFKSATPIRYGTDLASAQNLGTVRENSALNQRLTGLAGGARKYLRIDSASAPLAEGTGLFVATSTAPGSFYYAATASAANTSDTTIALGSNSLAAAVSEAVEMPQPVWQETRVVDGRTFHIYAQFATKVTSSIYPQMTNLGSYPFHFAILKYGSQSPHPVTFWLHGAGLNFLPTNFDFRSIGDPNEWVITIDDWTPFVIDGNYTLYYGFHENYDMSAHYNPVPSSGTLYNYTSARVVHTVQWALKYLPVDTTRTYMTGWSMGAIGTMFSALMMPAKIAAIIAYAPAFDITNPPLFADIVARMWGTPESNLPTNQGYRRNERLSTAFLMGAHKGNAFPVMYTFCGKADVTLDWSDKVPVYNMINSSRLGGYHYWSNEGHRKVFNGGVWQTNFLDLSFFTRYRTNLSFPAFSNCSINDNPGNGAAGNGAATGTINGHLDWNDNIVDVPNRWEITLRLKNILNPGLDLAPDSATTDVTLRRLQAFEVPRGSMIMWENRRNNIPVQQGSFAYDSGLVTIPGVRVYNDSSRLSVFYAPVSVAEDIVMPREYSLRQNYPNPFNPATTIGYQLPHAGRVSLIVYDVLGREVAMLVNEVKQPGTHTVQWDATGEPTGIYFYRLQAGSFAETKKLVVVK